MVDHNGPLDPYYAAPLSVPSEQRALRSLLGTLNNTFLPHAIREQRDLLEALPALRPPMDPRAGAVPCFFPLYIGLIPRA